MKSIIACVMLLGINISAFAEWSGAISKEIWQLPPSKTGSRWLIIHNLDSAESEGVYHVEVIERAFGSEAWNISHIANHLAITPQAMRASIVRPLKKGRVYPESFDYA